MLEMVLQYTTLGTKFMWMTSVAGGSSSGLEPGMQMEDDSKITLGELTWRDILKCMNSKNVHIQFTAEKPSDFVYDDYNIPNLDFKIGIN